MERKDDSFGKVVGDAAALGAFLIFFMYLFAGVVWLFVWLKEHPRATKIILLVLAWGIAEWFVVSWFLQLIAS